MKLISHDKMNETMTLETGMKSEEEPKMQKPFPWDANPERVEPDAPLSSDSHTPRSGPGLLVTLRGGLPPA